MKGDFKGDLLQNLKICFVGMLLDVFFLGGVIFVFSPISSLSNSRPALDKEGDFGLAVLFFRGLISTFFGVCHTHCSTDQDPVNSVGSQLGTLCSAVL